MTKPSCLPPLFRNKQQAAARAAAKVIEAAASAKRDAVKSKVLDYIDNNCTRFPEQSTDVHSLLWRVELYCNEIHLYHEEIRNHPHYDGIDGNAACLEMMRLYETRFNRACDDLNAKIDTLIADAATVQAEAKPGITTLRPA
jgi:hypothetical protein